MRGLFKRKGSGYYWMRYADLDGKIIKKSTHTDDLYSASELLNEKRSAMQKLKKIFMNKKGADITTSDYRKLKEYKVHIVPPCVFFLIKKGNIILEDVSMNLPGRINSLNGEYDYDKVIYFPIDKVFAKRYSRAYLETLIRQNLKTKFKVILRSPVPDLVEIKRRELFSIRMSNMLKQFISKQGGNENEEIRFD